MMNIKQAEQLTGITQQNIRFYEKQGLLSPARNAENNYREYTDEDIQTLKRIKMLRMLKLPVEQIAQVLSGSVPLNAAMEKQLKVLKQEQEQLAAVISFCQELEKETLETLDVDERLSQMAEREKAGGVFANIAKDFMAVAQAEERKEFRFSPDSMIRTPEEFTTELFAYANQNDLDMVLTKESMYPEFTIDGLAYTAERHFTRFGAVVTCRLKNPELAEPASISKKKRRIYAVLWKLVLPVVLFLFLFFTRVSTITDINSFLSVSAFAMVITLTLTLPLNFFFPKVKS